MDIKKSVEKKEVKVPADVRDAVSSSALIEAKWNDLTPIARRDFISWVEQAVRADTRKRRIDRIPDMLKSGKRRPCCYAIVPMDLYKALGANPKEKAVWGKLSPDKKRDLSDSVENIKDKEVKRERIEKVCAKLASGKISA